MRRSCLAALALACGWGGAACARIVPVHDTAGLQAALVDAHEGDTIVLADGVYPIDSKLLADMDGSSTAPITVRAAHALKASIRSRAQIAFEVTGTDWHFDGLDMRGVCAIDTKCEHAFHVVGAADRFALANSRLVDFNAHVKVNADVGHNLPADGLIENNEFFDTHPRHTGNPVAPVNIDNAIAWVVRGNRIHDFQKDGPGEPSYGAFVKGGAQAPVLERNLVECASGAPPVGTMYGLSFGAHGMDPALCPPHWDGAVPCDPEVTGGVMRNNIVGHCNAEGIYLNRAKDSKILFNTLVDTGGIAFRYAGSTGIARGNLLMGAIRGEERGSFNDAGNAALVASEQQIAQWHTEAGGKAHVISLPQGDAGVADDYCGRRRAGALDMGALQATLGPCPLLHWAGRGSP